MGCMISMLHTYRLARAARSSDASSTLQLVEERPALLMATCAALHGTLWHWAAARGDVVLLQDLIRCVIRQTAAGAVQQELCQLLDQRFNLDTTPLMLACRHGHAEAVRTLLQHGADAHLTDRRGNNTCLHTAAYAGHASVIRVILDTRATYPLLVEAGVADASAVQHPEQQEQGTALLLDKGNLYQLTALHMAVCGGRAEAATVLLEAGASLLSCSSHPTPIGRLYLPQRTSPLHAAVHARDLQCALLLLTAHEQRFGGTAAGMARDPRRLLDENRRSPWQLARHIQMPDAFCGLLDPSTPLREYLQALAAQQQQQQHDPLVQQQQHLCRSLQELAGMALKKALLSQLHCVAAAAGVVNSAGGEQQQPEATATTEALGAAAAELFMRLQDSVIVCISMTQSERLCVQVGQHAAAAAVGEQRTGALQQSLLDVMRLYILCHGVCDPGEPSSCWFAAACPSCPAVACAAAGSSNALAMADCNTWSLQDLQCCFMPASQCGQLPGAATLDCSSIVPLLQSIESGCAARWSMLQSHGNWREACGVCFEEQGLLLHLKPCKHVLCMGCIKLLVALVTSKPALCPFCRAAIAGVHVYVGEGQAAVADVSSDV